MQNITKRNHHFFSIHQCEEDRFINLTELCKVSIKQLADFNRRPATQDLLFALSKQANRTMDSLRYFENAEQWGHPAIAMAIADWLDPEFGIWFRASALDWAGGYGLDHSEPEKMDATNLLNNYTGKIQRGTLIGMNQIEKIAREIRQGEHPNMANVGKCFASISRDTWQITARRDEIALEEIERMGEA